MLHPLAPFHCQLMWCQPVFTLPYPVITSLPGTTLLKLSLLKLCLLPPWAIALSNSYLLPWVGIYFGNPLVLSLFNSLKLGLFILCIRSTPWDLTFIIPWDRLPLGTLHSAILPFVEIVFQHYHQNDCLWSGGNILGNLLKLIPMAEQLTTPCPLRTETKSIRSRMMSLDHRYSPKRSELLTRPNRKRLITGRGLLNGGSVGSNPQEGTYSTNPLGMG